jgi:putative membrane protein
VTPPTAETQRERTSLAWQRTGLGVLGVAALLGHGALEHRRPALLVIAGVVALLGLGVLGGLAPSRYRRLRGTADGGAAGSRPVAAAAAAGVVCLTAVAAVAGVLSLR